MPLDNSGHISRRMPLAARILSAISADVADVPLDDGSVDADPLKTLLWAFPDLPDLVTGKHVLDFGCGFGAQAAAIAQCYGAVVTGFDTDESYLTLARERYGHLAHYVSSIDPNERWDVVVSLNAMEHYSDPQRALQEMREALSPEGVILMTFGPPWWAPYGSHMNLFCPVPWLQLWFSERTVMEVRRRYRNDGALRYEEIQGGLNKMSLRKFEHLIQQSGIALKRLRYHGVRGMDWTTGVPLLRELLTNHVSAILGR